MKATKIPKGVLSDLYWFPKGFETVSDTLSIKYNHQYIADKSDYRQDPELSELTLHEIAKFSSYCVIKLAFIA